MENTAHGCLEVVLQGQFHEAVLSRSLVLNVAVGKCVRVGAATVAAYTGRRTDAAHMQVDVAAHAELRKRVVQVALPLQCFFGIQFWFARTHSPPVGIPFRLPIVSSD